MASKTNAELIVEALQASSRPLDDDQLAFRSGVKPRQTVNRICRDLEASGFLRRYLGPDQKIVNEIVSGGPALVTTQSIEPPQTLPFSDTWPVQKEKNGLPAVSSEDAASAGSSHEQRAAEAIMLAELAKTLSLVLAPRRLTHSSGARVELDGADSALRVLVECWAHQGPAKVAQKYKLMNDAVKLYWIAQDLSPAPERLVLCVSDESAVRHLRGKSWQGRAMADLGIEVHVVSLPAEVVAAVSQAQARQYR